MRCLTYLIRAGVGRTGAYIVLDAMLDRANAQNDIDIFNYISSMRTRRIAMVQTEVRKSCLMECHFAKNAFPSALFYT